MRAELSQAARRAVVRRAGRRWRKAGVIDESALRAIEAQYPSDRITKPLIWRALIFTFSCVILCSFFGLLAATNHPSTDGMTILALAFGIALAVATEFQQGPLRFDGTGGEAATSFLSLAFLIAAAALGVLDRSVSPARAGGVLLFAALVCAAAWWRWGFPIYALFSAVLLLFGVACLVAFPRLGWIALAGLLAVACSPCLDRESLAPAQRAGVGAVLACALAAEYAAVNLFSLDRGWIEELRPGPPAAGAATPVLRALSILLTALFPLGVAVFGIRTRRRLLIDLGFAFGALSLVTLRAYVSLGPTWIVLAEAGIGLVILALGIERYLEGGRRRVRAGLTAEPLFEGEGKAELLTAAAAAAMLTPETRVGRDEGGLTPGGGGFGGGGASGEL
ncbi:MAG: hypothetical protein ACRD16_06955 [Thermoanaerobaculia bacterium]